MKLKKVLAISLLSSVLVLTSCENLINQFGNRSKKGDAYGSNVEGSDYTGKKGATELNKDEWDKAFSLEETAMHRSLKVECVQDERAVVTSEIDHGRIKMTMSYSDGDYSSSSTAYMDIKNVNGGSVSGTAYNNYGGKWEPYSLQGQSIDMCMSQAGLLPYEYNDFTYDVSSKSYKADYFTVNIEEQLVLEVYDCTIKVENGLPSKVEFDFSNGDSTRYSYSATYSEYGNVSVTIPNAGGGSSSSTIDLPTPDGEKISLKDFIDAFNAKKEADFNHAVIAISETADGQTYTTSYQFDYLYGVWQSDESTESMNEVIESLILSEDNLEDLMSNSLEIEFYYDAKNKEYSLAYEAELLGSYISTVSTYNEYFYAVKQEIAVDKIYEKLEVKWATDDLSFLTMNVSGRSFVGLTILEKDFAKFDQYVEVYQNTTMYFNNGICKLVQTKAIDDNQLVDINVEMYGYYYQDGNEVRVGFTYTAINGEKLPVDESYDIDYLFTVEQDTLVIEAAYDDGVNETPIHIVFKYSEPFNEIIQPDNPINDDVDNFNGEFSFVFLDCELKDGGTDEQAIAEIENIYADEELADILLNSAISIDLDEGLFALIQEDGARIGSFKINGNTLSASLNSFVDYYTGERSEITPQNITCKLSEDGYVYLKYKETETYIIYVVYLR